MARIVKGRSQKAGLPPGTPVHIGERKVERAQVWLVHYTETQILERRLEAIEDCAALRAEGGGVTWVHVSGVHDLTLLARLGECFGLHPLVLEDISNTDQRPKLEDYHDYAYIVLKSLQDGTAAAGGEVVSEQVSLILGRDFVLSFEEREPTLFEPVRERLRHNGGRIRRYGADYLAYSLIDAVVDGYFIVLERLGERVEQLQEALVATPTSDTQQALHRLRHELMLLRRSVWPLREVVGGLERGVSDLVREATRVYLRDVYDHVAHVIDTVETLRETVAGLLEIYLTSLSNRLNEIMKVLTIIATVFMPLTFIAGIYGMNFRYMPELEWRWGYPLVLLAMLAVAAGMLVYFRRKKWI